MQFALDVGGVSSDYYTFHSFICLYYLENNKSNVDNDTFTTAS